MALILQKKRKAAGMKIYFGPTLNAYVQSYVESERIVSGGQAMRDGTHNDFIVRTGRIGNNSEGHFRRIRFYRGR